MWWFPISSGWVSEPDTFPFLALDLHSSLPESYPPPPPGAEAVRDYCQLLSSTKGWIVRSKGNFSSLNSERQSQYPEMKLKLNCRSISSYWNVSIPRVLVKHVLVCPKEPFPLYLLQQGYTGFPSTCACGTYRHIKIHTILQAPLAPTHKYLLYTSQALCQAPGSFLPPATHPSSNPAILTVPGCCFFSLCALYSPPRCSPLSHR